MARKVYRRQGNKFNSNELKNKRLITDSWNTLMGIRQDTLTVRVLVSSAGESGMLWFEQQILYKEKKQEGV